MPASVRVMPRFQCMDLVHLDRMECRVFVRQSWYVAARADEIAPGGKPGRTFLGEPVLLYRGLPLSRSCVRGDQIQCGYHGLTFNARGLCINVLGQGRIPPAARVQRYEVVEQDHLIWIWIGDEVHADPSVIPRHPWHEDPAWEYVKDRYPIPETSSHYFWSGAHKRQPGAASVAERLRASLEVTFAEDKVVVEAQQVSLTRRPTPLVLIASDAGMMRARRLAQARLDAEAALRPAPAQVAIRS
jgi:phenylpropionate dioxygenase-like ring-hydroxylating dioxygenase large terminal subunit